MENEMNETPEVETTAEGPKYPLLFDSDGVALKLPPNANKLRVRKLAKHAGRPKMVIDSDTGRPLEIDLETSYEDFCDLVGESGRYRLEVIDDKGYPIPCCVAVTVVELGEEVEIASSPQTAAEALPIAMQLIDKLVQSNTRAMEAMASAFGQVHPAPTQVVMSSAPPPAPAPPPKQENPLAVFQQVMEMFSTKKPDAAATNGVTAPLGVGDKPQG